MPAYYLYHLGPTGRITGRDVIEADDDAKAAALADKASDGDAMELWQGARKVATFASRLTRRTASPTSDFPE